MLISALQDPPPSSTIKEPKPNAYIRIDEVIRTFLLLMAQLNQFNSDQNRAMRADYCSQTNEGAHYMRTWKVALPAGSALVAAAGAYALAAVACPSIAGYLGTTAPAVHAPAFSSAGFQLGQSIGQALSDATLKSQEARSALTMNDLQTHANPSSQTSAATEAAYALLRASQDLLTAASRSN
jgi:hypothetical protein